MSELERRRRPKLNSICLSGCASKHQPIPAEQSPAYRRIRPYASLARGDSMNAVLSRRKMIKAVGATALWAPLAHGSANPALRGEGRDTPKICLEIDGGLSAGTLD